MSVFNHVTVDCLDGNHFLCRPDSSIDGCSCECGHSVVVVDSETAANGGGPTVPSPQTGRGTPDLIERDYGACDVCGRSVCFPSCEGGW